MFVTTSNYLYLSISAVCKYISTYIYTFASISTYRGTQVHLQVQVHTEVHLQVQVQT